MADDGLQETVLDNPESANFTRACFALAVVVSLGGLLVPSVTAQSPTCAEFDAWPWAQTVFEQDPAAYQATMDPDFDTIACPDLPIGGFAPLTWTGSIPAGAEPAQVVSITDGDTFDVLVNGAPDTVRMYHIDTPETTHFGGGLQCGGNEATDYLAYVLGFAPGGTVYLEYDQTQRDDFDRRLAYVWYQIGSDVYLVNEAMVRNGWAESQTFEPDVKYRDQLNAAEQFSVDKVLGVRLECGRFGQPVGSQPSQEQIAQAWRSQPNQGQLPPLPTPGQAPSGGEQAPQPQPTQPVPTPTPAPPVAPPPTGDCDPSYPGVCIPPIGVSGDLDCGDVGPRRFQVVPPDPHNFDGDFDGIGCESG
jgi:micrococcal nuclease